MADQADKPSAIKVKNVTKIFRLPQERHRGLKQLFLHLFRKGGYEEQYALKGVSLEIKQGDFFGIVGRNGSGKSTLLKLLAGIYTPTQGRINVVGKLTPFIELGVGFNPELTGRENVFLNGALLGFSHKEMEGMYEDIVDFAELERFMDQKLKNYSSGMQVRLAFSIAIRAQSDILLLDEVLAVGDAAFQQKCYDYFHELKKKKLTVILVSHDRGVLERFCGRGVLIDKGRVVSSGPIRKVLKEYSKVVLDELDQEPRKEKETTKSEVLTSFAEINKTRTLDKKGETQKKFTFAEPVTAEFTVVMKQTIVNPIIGLTVWQKNVDKPLFATNTLIAGTRTTTYKAGESVVLRTRLPAGMNDGEYYVEPAIANESGTVFYDRRPKAATFFVNGSSNPYSILATEEKITISVEK